MTKRARVHLLPTRPTQIGTWDDGSPMYLKQLWHCEGCGRIKEAEDPPLLPRRGPLDWHAPDCPVIAFGPG